MNIHPPVTAPHIAAAYLVITHWQWTVWRILNPLNVLDQIMMGGVTVIQSIAFAIRIATRPLRIDGECRSDDAAVSNGHVAAVDRMDCDGPTPLEIHIFDDDRSLVFHSQASMLVFLRPHRRGAHDIARPRVTFDRRLCSESANDYRFSKIVLMVTMNRDRLAL